MVRFEGVARGGTPQAALEPLELELRDNELLVLLGPAASGKSTVLGLLAGTLLPDAGRILVRGDDLARLPSRRRGFGAVLPGAPLVPGWTVADNVSRHLRGLGIGRAERAERTARALEFVELAAAGGRRVAALAPEQLPRAALARALAAGPDLLLLDDPFAGLDRAPRDELQLLLRALHRRLGLTVLHATRDAHEAMMLADRVALLHRGVLRQLGAPRQLYEEPASAFAAGYLGENNALPGTVLALEEDGECRVRLDCGPEVEARRVDTGGPGARCVVAVRPERVAVAAMAPEQMGEGALPARLIEAMFLGDHVRLRLALGDARDSTGRSGILLARRPAAGPLPRSGDAAAVAWNPGHALAFRPEALRD